MSNTKQTAYFLFAQDQRPAMETKHPRMNGHCITSELAKAWQALSEEDRASYMRQAESKCRVKCLTARRAAAEEALTHHFTITWTHELGFR